MPKFAVGDRVTVPDNNPHAPSNMHGWVGKVLALPTPPREQYMVAFDGHVARACPEDWLELA